MDIANKQAEALGAQSAPAKCFSQKEKHQASSEAARRYDATPHALFNDRVVVGDDTQRVLKSEQPHHRLMVLMRARGFSTSEIAEQLGYTPSTVSIALRQPWARQLLVDMLQGEGLAGLQQLLKAELVPSVLRLVEVRDAEESKGSEVIAASNSIIDRFLGRPTQRIETAQAPVPTDVDELEREMQRNASELQRLKAN